MVAIKDPGPPVSEVDVDRFEKLLEARLPDDYRAFLLETDGGRPEPDTIDVPGLEGSPTGIQEFFGIDGALETSRLDWNLATYSLRVEPGRLPIATDAFGSIFSLSLRPDDYGSIVYHDLEAVYGDLGRRPRIYPVAASFGELLLRIRSGDHPPSPNSEAAIIE